MSPDYISKFRKVEDFPVNLKFACYFIISKKIFALQNCDYSIYEEYCEEQKSLLNDKSL